ncbi:hypothetical protein XELAEV_18029018mg [Xenopus laevis]|uniref:Uncharacterized protein n=1 Tax=Xenopus laevis TaxID=8355 RepID=A0A974CT77_XENLA|nr:hypothetical protein XELAEV_18029018mg [Xenopus laevis]
MPTFVLHCRFQWQMCKFIVHWIVGNYVTVLARKPIILFLNPSNGVRLFLNYNNHAQLLWTIWWVWGIISSSTSFKAASSSKETIPRNKMLSKCVLVYCMDVHNW